MANGTNPSLWTSSSFNTPNPPARPILSTPSNTALISGYTPTLKWNPALVPAGAPPLAYYHVQVDDQEDFSSPLYDQSVSLATEFPIIDPLSENMKYYWRVRAVNIEEQFSWWSTRSFRTRIYPLTIETPEAGTVSESLRPTFRWSSSPHASEYTLVVSTLADFSSSLINVTLTNNSYLPAIDLPSATVIHWRVMARGSNPSIWTTASFTTPNPPLRAVLQSPTGNVVIYTYNPTLTWKSVIAPANAPAFASYHLQVDNDPDYSSPIYDVPGLTLTSFSIPENLPSDQRYFWRVRALNVEDQFSWWSSSSFRTVVRPPETIAPDPDAVLLTQKPYFDWSDVDGATSYTIAASLYSDLSSPLFNVKVTESQYTPTISLPKGKVIYWRVRAHGNIGSSQWTAVRTFKIQ
jgi:large repetitive protein